jgi:hypothetical protein
MQHKVVCKLLLKVVCGSSVLLIVLSQVSQSVRLTSALVNNNYCEESSIFCTASDSFVSILGICSRHTRIGICDGRILAFRHAGTEVDFCFIVEDTFCRLIINVKPELKLIKGLLLIVSMSSPDIANTFVVRSWLSLPGHMPQKKRSNNSFFQISHFKIFCPIKQRTKVCCALALRSFNKFHVAQFCF